MMLFHTIKIQGVSLIQTHGFPWKPALLPRQPRAHAGTVRFQLFHKIQVCLDKNHASWPSLNSISLFPYAGFKTFHLASIDTNKNKVSN